MLARKYLSALVAVALLGQALPVWAHDDDDDDEDHYRHHRRYERRIEQRYYYEPRVVGPAPVYVYEAPPPVVVYPSAPPPVVYQYNNGGDALAPFVLGAVVGGVLHQAARRR